MSAVLEEISKFLQQGRVPAIKQQVRLAVSEGLTAREILEGGLLAGMNVIGEKIQM